MLISEKILYLRKKSNFTQEELAEHLNVSRQSISKWEGAQSIPDITKIMAMANLFGVSTDYLLRDDIENLDGEPPVTSNDSNFEVVTIETANSFINAHKKYSNYISLAVLIFIISVVPLIALQSIVDIFIQETLATTIGCAFLFLSIAAGVALCIYGYSIISDFKYISNGQFELSYNVFGIIKEYQNSYKQNRTKTLILSICAIVLSVLPLVIVGTLSSSDSLQILALSLMFIVIAISVSRLICSEGRWTSFQILLSEGDYKKDNKKKEIVQNIFWLITLSVYLAWSFLTNDWHISWLVWPIAALLSAVLELVLDAKKQ